MAIVKIDNLGELGTIQDTASSELLANALNAAQNISYRYGNIVPSVGYKITYDVNFTGAAINGVLMMRAPDALTRRVYACTQFRIYKYTSLTTVSDITRETASVKVPYTGAVINKWTNFVFNGFAYFNNSIDEPQVYNDVAGTTPVQSLPGWSSTWRAKSLRAYKNAIIAMNMTEGGVNFPHLLRFSDTAAPGSQPTSWVAATTNKAGSVPMAESQGAIVDGLQLNDSFIIYKQDSYYRMTFIGGNDVYRIQKINNCPGLLSQNCVVQYPGGHFCLGSNLDVYVHNGGDYKSVLQGRLKERFRNRTIYVGANRSQYFVTIDAERRECLVCFSDSASAAGCLYAYAWNWEEDTWSEREMPFVLAAATGQLDSAIVGDADSEFTIMAGIIQQIYVIDGSLPQGATTPTRSIQRDGLDFGNKLAVKTVRSFTPNIVGTPGDIFLIGVKSAYEPSGIVGVVPSYTFTLGTSVEMPVMVTGRFFSYIITTQSVNPWKLRSVQFDVELRGRY